MIVDEGQQPPALDTSVAEKQAVEPADVDGGYGWVNVVCMLLLTAHTGASMGLL